MLSPIQLFFRTRPPLPGNAGITGNLDVSFKRILSIVAKLGWKNKNLGREFVDNVESLASTEMYGKKKAT